MKKILFTLIFCSLHAVTLAQIKIAVAANLQSVIKVLAVDYKTHTGNDLEIISGSSGNLVTQIKNGAPFDVFLSADMGFPETLFKDGFTTGRPVGYAFGSLIICSTTKLELQNWPQLITKNEIKTIAIANPAIAPYGKAAKEALSSLHLADIVKSKMITGESIAQVNTYIFNNETTVGFTTQSFVYESGQSKKLYWAIVNPKSYAPIAQGMVVLKHAQGKNLLQAEKFYKYMLSAPAKAILKKYGYH